jgi:outer membrane protein assembly factor BamE (lipoprotein component of BamABCDE complex)
MKMLKRAGLLLFVLAALVSCVTKTPKQTDTSSLDRGNTMKNEAVRDMDRALDNEYN